MQESCVQAQTPHNLVSLLFTMICRLNASAGLVEVLDALDEALVEDIAATAIRQDSEHTCPRAGLPEVVLECIECCGNGAVMHILFLPMPSPFPHKNCIGHLCQTIAVPRLFSVCWIHLHFLLICC